MLYTRNLTKLSSDDIAIAGGKGAALGELVRANISVPNGFVVLTGAFDKFIDGADLRQDIRAQLKKVTIDKIHTVELASKKIQSMLSRAEMPKDIAKTIVRDFSTLGAKYVAVRSSATAEDSDSAAWAGQLDTYLNTTEETLLENVQKCWVSLFTVRAIFYRFEKGLKESLISVAVVVQEMIESESAGIAFSVHPITQDKNQMIIEAGFGLGEAVVSGAITPDSYVVSKKDYKIIDINVHGQLKALCRKEGGDNEWKNLGDKGMEQVLSRKDILKLARIIKKIESHYKTPQDIEWAFAKNKFYFTQSRPITTLDIKNNKKVVEMQQMLNSGDSLYPATYLSQFDVENSGHSHILASKRIILAFLAMEIWEESEKISYKLGYKEIQNELLFFHEKGREYRVYHKKDYFDWMNDKSYISDPVKLNKFSKIFLKSNKKLEKSITKYHNIKLTNILKKITEIFALTDYFFFIRNEENIILFTRKEQNKITKLRSYSEKIVHHAYVSILGEANEIMHTINKSTDAFKEEVYLADYITKNDLLIVLGGDEYKIKRIIKKAKKIATAKCFAYHNSKVYLNDKALNIVEKHAGLENKNLFAYKTKKTDNILCGNTAVIGKAEGLAVVVRNWQDIHKVNDATDDIILVCSDLTPEVSAGMNMGKVRGIIVETGSTLCHAAIIAREYNRPTAISVVGLCDIIQDKMNIVLSAQKTGSKVYYK